MHSSQWPAKPAVKCNLLRKSHCRDLETFWCFLCLSPIPPPSRLCFLPPGLLSSYLASTTGRDTRSDPLCPACCAAQAEVHAAPGATTCLIWDGWSGHSASFTSMGGLGNSINVTASSIQVQERGLPLQSRHLTSPNCFLTCRSLQTLRSQEVPWRETEACWNRVALLMLQTHVCGVWW